MKVNKTVRTKLVKREASVARSKALDELYNKYTNAEVISFKRNGAVYEALLRFGADDESSDDDGGEESGPPKPEAGGGDGPPPSDDGPDDDGDDDGGPDGPPTDGDVGLPGAEHHKQSPEEQILHVLTEILHALKGGPGGHPGGPMGPGGPHGAPMDAMAEVGAPDKGMGGPPGHGGPPLPPPAVKHNMPGMGAPAFASKRTFVAELDQGNGLTIHQAIESANESFPGYRVAKLERDEKANKIRVAMVSRS